MNLPAFWVNHDPQASLACDDRGFSYGDGLFETLRYHRGHFQLLNAHLQRLQRGCAVLDLAYPAQDIETQLNSASDYLHRAGIEQARLRLALSRGPGAPGYAPSLQPEAGTLVCALYEVTLPWGELPEPAHAIECDIRLASQPQLAGIKHSNRLEQVLAAAQVSRAAAQEGVVCNQRGEVVSAVSANLFAWDGDSWLTPPITDCGVKGTVRDFLFNDVGPRHNIPMREKNIAMADLGDFHSVIICNSIIGLRALASLDGRPLPQGEEITTLYRALIDTMEGASH